VELDASQRDDGSGAWRLRPTREHSLWGLYERAAALLPQSLESPESRRELAAVDALMREWRRTPGGRRKGGPHGPHTARSSTVSKYASADVSAMSSTKVNSQSLQATLLTLGIPAVASSCSSCSWRSSARILLDPLRAIANSAQKISGGAFDVSLPRESRDEIGDLVRAFREMITAVQRPPARGDRGAGPGARAVRDLAALRAKAEREHQAPSRRRSTPCPWRW